MALQEAIDSALHTLEAEPSSSRLGRLSTLGSQVRDRLRDALHISVKRALAMVSSHYQVDLDNVCDGYIVGEEHEDHPEEEIMRLNATVEEPGKTLAKLFEDEVLPHSDEDGEDL